MNEGHRGKKRWGKKGGVCTYCGVPHKKGKRAGDKASCKGHTIRKKGGA